MDYRSEGIFGLVLLVCATASHCLSYYIPVDLFDGAITAIQNTCTASVCVLGALLMFVHSEGLRIRKAWGWTMLIWGLFDAFLLVQTYVLGMPALAIGSDKLTAFDLLVANLLAWLLFIYPTEVLRPNWLTFPKALLQLLPIGALVGLDYLVPIDLSYIIMCYPLVLAVMLSFHLRAYRLWCEQNFSSMDRIDIQWIVRYLVMLLVLGLSLFYMCLTTNPARAFTQQWLLLLIFGYSTVQILFRPDPWKKAQRDTMQDVNEAPTNNVPGTKAEPNPSNAAYRATLEAWIAKEKPYLRPDFQLKDLNQVLPLNRTYLSQLINSEYGCSFYQYVNGLRIEEAKRLMREHPEMTMEEVSRQSGFSSRRVFTQIFTRETGNNPSEWNAKR